jgi:hypothetical protein
MAYGCWNQFGLTSKRQLRHSRSSQLHFICYNFTVSIHGRLDVAVPHQSLPDGNGPTHRV